MVAMPLSQAQYDDPRKLRDLLDKMVNLAGEHRLKSVAVGLSGLDNDLMFPELVNYVGSSLRVDDSIFRMTRNRAVLFLADADLDRAREIMERVLSDFAEQFAVSDHSTVRFTYFEVAPGTPPATLKEILPVLFAPPSESH
jgi:GGDEF domain-containing protein